MNEMMHIYRREGRGGREGGWSKQIYRCRPDAADHAPWPVEVSQTAERVREWQVLRSAPISPTWVSSLADEAGVGNSSTNATGASASAASSAAASAGSASAGSAPCVNPTATSAVAAAVPAAGAGVIAMSARCPPRVASVTARVITASAAEKAVGISVTASCSRLATPSPKALSKRDSNS